MAATPYRFRLSSQCSHIRRHVCRRLITPQLSVRTCATGTESSNGARLIEVMESPIENIKILSMNNAPANVLSSAMIKEMLSSISEVCNPEKGCCKGIVLTSSLPNVFCNGLDLQLLSDKLPYDSFSSYWKQLQMLYITLNTLPVPVVAAINGDATGFGCIMALSTDYRVMAEKAEEGGGKQLKIGVDTVRCGLAVPPCFGAVVAHTVGYRACEMFLQRGVILCAAEAENAGLVDETVERADEVLVRALDMAENLSVGPPWSFWLVKDASRKAFMAPLCTQALRDADCANFYEFISNTEVRRDMRAYIAGSA
ncbi:3,2-trans-enoyl-CoA isomerase, mitochondrial precursor, putative [Trypanosoma brucei gambiense DAL972]|uniref:3,2-trans-enoyl-CoA isomerase, mitochondrial, putative n=2 Tax=Trypanosoma brucei TaxID=5691 RepID=C9ZKS4_TRYB9|nr:3,2-trans-enoyl-CoA isomerase, mitochondrial precursor, putative [Trypanosoma brucei gambiense DAL972]CBH10290.1 3,2-trans-enoyl-CoA isomerase, mitochondrial precursor, putative [Trypanosoma brucei gambiense DAL972]|eukprot:XP_011772580.1 3,2-trans-enoyl-CoA isomerase, mitochondrial precursor, putative [Trypanosoma brucei gambiense DAL972]